MERGPTSALIWLIGLPVEFLGGEDGPNGEASVFVQSSTVRGGCPVCGSVVWVKDATDVEVIDLPIYGRAARTVWRKCRFVCPASECAIMSFTEAYDRIAGPWQRLTSRAARWATEQVGRHARSVNKVATDLGCDWHTVNDTVVAYGEVFIDDPDRFSDVEALGLDEVLFVRVGTYRTPTFSTQLVDVKCGQLLDVVEGRRAEEPKAWLENRGEKWLDKVGYATVDLSATYSPSSTPPSPMRPRWRIRSTSSNTPPSISTNAADGSNKNSSDITAGKAILCSGPVGCSPRPTSDWTNEATRS